MKKHYYFFGAAMAAATPKCKPLGVLKDEKRCAKRPGCQSSLTQNFFFLFGSVLCVCCFAFGVHHVFKLASDVHLYNVEV